MQRDHILKKINFDLFTLPQGQGWWGGGGVCGQYICYHVAEYAIRPCSEKVEFDPFDPHGRRCLRGK